jgi:hypothetical protein
MDGFSGRGNVNQSKTRKLMIENTNDLADE